MTIARAGSWFITSARLEIAPGLDFLQMGAANRITFSWVQDEEPGSLRVKPGSHKEVASTILGTGSLLGTASYPVSSSLALIPVLFRGKLRLGLSCEDAN